MNNIGYWQLKIIGGIVGAIKGYPAKGPKTHIERLGRGLAIFRFFCPVAGLDGAVQEGHVAIFAGESVC